MHAILEALRQEHRNIGSLLNTLEWQLDEFERDSAPDYDVIGETLDYFLSFPDILHHPKEDLVFAKLRLRDGAAAAAIGDLRAAHEELAARARELAEGLRAVLGEQEIPRAALVQRAKRFIDLQRRHVEMEERSFFPAADKALSAADWTELGARMAKGDDPLFGDYVSPRFDRLRQKILAWQAQDELLRRQSEV